MMDAIKSRLMDYYQDYETAPNGPPIGCRGMTLKVRDCEGKIPLGSSGFGYTTHFGPQLAERGWVVLDSATVALVWTYSRYDEEAGCLIVTGGGRLYKDGVVIEEFPGIEDWENDDG